MHSPKFSHIVGAHMSDRELLGLPETYQDLRTAHTSDAMSALIKLDTAGWISTLENASAPAQDRLSAGLLLALTGDPRIDTFAPQMCPIQAGTVQIGLAESELQPALDRMDGLGIDPDWIKKELPRHDVSLAPYQIGRYPVTNLEYKDFLNDCTEGEIPSTWAFGRFPEAQANHPVHTISAQSAERYCAWLANHTGRPYRLPTESEWEYAAAGPDGREFPWGDSFAADHANLAEEGYITASPVGAFPAGRAWCGADDMAGNVEEFTADLYGPYPGAEMILDDLALQQQDYHVARGGSYTRFFDLARTRRRHGHYLRDIYVMGFRLAETL